jgi:hypothetical protein
VSREDAELAYRRKRAARFWTGICTNDVKLALQVEDAILACNDKSAMELLAAAGCHDPDLLIEQVKPDVVRRERVRRTCSDLVKLEARILRRVAGVLNHYYTEAYHSMGGPQDGDSSPSEFDAERAANDLLEAALEVENDELEALDEAAQTDEGCRS